MPLLRHILARGRHGLLCILPELSFHCLWHPWPVDCCLRADLITADDHNLFAWSLFTLKEEDRRTESRLSAALKQVLGSSLLPPLGVTQGTPSQS